jgi:hypothetical protein
MLRGRSDSEAREMIAPWLQELLAYAVVLAAVGWTVGRWHRNRTRGCSACSAVPLPRSAAPLQGVRARGLTILR